MTIKKNVIALGVTSFFTDVSSEMILSLLPLFLLALGAGKGVIGLIEGVAEAVASITKVFSGWLSDKLGKRKIFVVIGYGLSTLVKPWMAVAGDWLQVLGVRFVDRLGKGIRTSPRDALIADSTENFERGKSFGFHRAMDTAGAVVGTLLASLFLFTFSKFFNWEIIFQYRTIFWISVIPGIISILVLILYVKDIGNVGKPFMGFRDTERGKPFPYITFSRNFKIFLFVVSIFGFSYFSYALFILRAADLGVAVALIPIIYLLYNLVYSILATPVGQLADLYGKKRMLSAGYFIFAALCLGFAFSTLTFQAWLLFAVYGIVSAIIETVPRAMIPDFVPAERVGTAYGFYYTLMGLVALPASALAGILWDVFGKVSGPLLAFSYGGILALLAGVLLVILIPAGETR